MIEKHTPGPWFAALDPTNFPDLVHTKSPKGHCPGKLVGVGKAQPDGDFSEACANSRLIAAAPELLEACEEMVSARCDECGAIGLAQHFSNISCSSSCPFYKGRAAITKAKGESCAT